MPLYNEQTESKTIETTTYDRSNQVIVYNPYLKTPSIEYREERIQTITDGVNSTTKSLGNVGFISKELTPENSGTEFNLINPLTQEALGTTATYLDLQVLLYSLYFHLATERDNA